MVSLSTIKLLGFSKPLSAVGSTFSLKRGALGRICGEGANGYRGGGVECVVLDDNGRPRLAGVVTASGNGPDLASPHSCTTTETAIDETLVFGRMAAPGHGKGLSVCLLTEGG